MARCGAQARQWDGVRRAMIDRYTLRVGVRVELGPGHLLAFRERDDVVASLLKRSNNDQYGSTVPRIGTSLEMFTVKVDVTFAAYDAAHQLSKRDVMPFRCRWP